MTALVYDPWQAGFQDRAYAIYRRLRDEAPCYRDRERGSFALSRHSDVRAAVADPGTFSSEGTSLDSGLPQIQQLDPPRHHELRALVSAAFTARRVAAMEPRVRAIARELVDGFAARGRCDLLAEFARHLPSRVIGELIGVPPERSAAFLEWTEALVAGGVETGSGREAVKCIYEEFARLLEARRRARRDDLMSALVDAEIDGRRLTQEELLGFCFVLIVAGNDTTTNLIANGAVLLARHPGQRRRLVREPRALPAAIEEMVRCESPAQALPRIVTRDLCLHGVSIPAGSEVKLVFGSANHDEREFADPERFDIDREPKRHLGFGQGVHFCLGANLARLEARVAFEELLLRLPDYELGEEPRWLTSIWARAHVAVPLRFEPVPVGPAPA